MLIKRNLSIEGTIGGGLVEAMVIKAAGAGASGPAVSD